MDEQPCNSVSMSMSFCFDNVPDWAEWYSVDGYGEIKVFDSEPIDSGTASWTTKPGGRQRSIGTLYVHNLARMVCGVFRL